MNLVITGFIVLALGAKVPNDPPPKAPKPSSARPGVAFDELGCHCEDTFPDGYSCAALPDFEDNEWTHRDAGSFAIEASKVAALIATVRESFGEESYLALQGWADRRAIGKKRLWGEVSGSCRGKHQVADAITNLDLAFLRACELKEQLTPHLREHLYLLPPVDYLDPRWTKSTNQTLAGKAFKAAVLFVVLPDKGVCRQ